MDKAVSITLRPRFTTGERTPVPTVEESVRKKMLRRIFGPERD
jgi:hypothetical protein